MSEEWPEEGFAQQLASRERVLVLYHGAWCPFSRIFLPAFEDAEPEASVPFARAKLRASGDPRWDAHNVRATPTLVYYEHGEELERAEATRGVGLNKRDLEDLLAHIDALIEEPMPRKLARRGPFSARRS